MRTRVGYSGGTTPDPTYHNIGDHTETLEIDFDPARISFAELMELYWQVVAPGPSWSRQYMRAIFFHDERQRQVAQEAREKIAATRRGLEAPLLPAGRFYRAEDYHQKYYLRHHAELMRHLGSVFAQPRDFVDSTAAARLNGHAGGHATVADLRAGAGDFDLPPVVVERLLVQLTGR